MSNYFGKLKKRKKNRAVGFFPGHSGIFLKMRQRFICPVLINGVFLKLNNYFINNIINEHEIICSKLQNHPVY